MFTRVFAKQLPQIISRNICLFHIFLTRQRYAFTNTWTLKWPAGILFLQARQPAEDLLAKANTVMNSSKVKYDTYLFDIRSQPNNREWNKQLLYKKTRLIWSMLYSIYTYHVYIPWRVMQRSTAMCKNSEIRVNLYGKRIITNTSIRVRSQLVHNLIWDNYELKYNFF